MYYKIFWFFNTFFLKLKFKKVGVMTYVAKPIFIYGGRKISIGNRVRIFPGSRMEAHDSSSIVFDNNISIGQNFHLISSGEELRICKDTTISGNVFITNIDHDYTQIGEHILNQKYLVKTTLINENCFIGYGAAIQAGTILGKQCIIGANAVVRGIFPDYCVIAGAPAKIIKRFNPENEIWEKTDSNGNFLNE